MVVETKLSLYASELTSVKKSTDQSKMGIQIQKR